MIRNHLPNYLKTYRKQVGFSQAELAFLFGFPTPNNISRYEYGKRKPNLISLLIYEMVFSVFIRQLYRGLHEETKHKLRQRASQLSLRIQSKGSKLNDQKLAFLAALMNRLNTEENEEIKSNTRYLAEEERQ